MFNSTLRITLALAILPALFFSQSGKNEKSSKPATITLSKPVDMGISDQRIFEDDQRKVKFGLVTSWIPGESHKGMLRYKMSVWVAKPKANGSSGDERDETADSLLKRVARCSITLEIFDRDGFIVRRHVVPFILGADIESGRVNALIANDTFQLESQEYRQFIDSGSWGLTWNCGFFP